MSRVLAFGVVLSQLKRFGGFGIGDRCTTPAVILSDQREKVVNPVLGLNLCLGRRIYDEVGFLRARLPDAHALIKTQDFSLRADSSNTSAMDVAHAARTQI